MEKLKPNELLARIDERQAAMADQLEAILAQTILTNGRVTALEKWKSRLGGIWFAVSIVIAAIATSAGIIISVVNMLK